MIIFWNKHPIPINPNHIFLNFDRSDSQLVVLDPLPLGLDELDSFLQSRHSPPRETTDNGSSPFVFCSLPLSNTTSSSESGFESAKSSSLSSEASSPCMLVAQITRTLPEDNLVDVDLDIAESKCSFGPKSSLTSPNKPNTELIRPRKRLASSWSTNTSNLNFSILENKMSRFCCWWWWLTDWLNRLILTFIYIVFVYLMLKIWYL